jgi:soluble lytic murein transglycosylase-like protein
MFAFPTPGAFFLNVDGSNHPVQEILIQRPIMAMIDPAVQAVENFLKHYGVDQVHLPRVAQSIVKSAKKYNLDPRLVASIVIVESRANPFAVSSADAIGIMQIHLPTWGRTADSEGVNLFRIEDNIDFGSRILKGYVKQSGLWDGVKRYKGWFPDNPESSNSAQQYVSKVRRIYGYEAPVASTADLLQ